MKNPIIISFVFLVSLLFPFYSEELLNNPAYIAQTGYGETKEIAENNALSAISKFFQTSISVSTKEQTVITESKSESKISEEVFVKSQTELFAVRYTKAKFDRKQKLYEVTAYINRDEAWRIYEPKLKELSDSFESLYITAISQDDPLLKISWLSKAFDNANENGLQKKLDFAQALNPTESENFSITRTHFSEIEPMISTLAGKCSINTICDVGVDENISKSANEVFSKIGILVVKENPDYLCVLKITENSQPLPAGTFFSPIISMDIRRSEKILFSWNRQLKKIGAKNEKVARQRAYSLISQTISDLLKNEFMPF